MSVTELEDFIIRLYPNCDQLARVGMSLCKATKLRQLVPISADSVEGIRSQIKKSQLFILPKRDLPVIGVLLFILLYFECL